MSYTPSFETLMKIINLNMEVENVLNNAAQEIAQQTGDNPYIIKNNTDMLPIVDNKIDFNSRGDMLKEERRLKRIIKAGENGKLTQLENSNEGITTKYMKEESRLVAATQRREYEKELTRRNIEYERIPIQKVDVETGEITTLWRNGHKVYETVGKTPSDVRSIQRLRNRGVLSEPKTLLLEDVKENYQPIIEHFGEYEEVSVSSTIYTPEQMVRGSRPDYVSESRIKNYFEQYSRVLDVSLPDMPETQEIINIIDNLEEKMSDELENIYYDIENNPELEVSSIEYLYSDISSPLVPRLQNARKGWRKIAEKYGVDYKQSEYETDVNSDMYNNISPLSELFALMRGGR